MLPGIQVPPIRCLPHCGLVALSAFLMLSGLYSPDCLDSLISCCLHPQDFLPSELSPHTFHISCLSLSSLLFSSLPLIRRFASAQSRSVRSFRLFLSHVPKNFQDPDSAFRTGSMLQGWSVSQPSTRSRLAFRQPFPS
jgi:hypothetical protein